MRRCDALSYILPVRFLLRIWVKKPGQGFDPWPDPTRTQIADPLTRVPETRFHLWCEHLAYSCYLIVLNPRPLDRKSDALTVTPPSHPSPSIPHIMSEEILSFLQSVGIFNCIRCINACVIARVMGILISAIHETIGVFSLRWFRASKSCTTTSTRTTCRWLLVVRWTCVSLTGCRISGYVWCLLTSAYLCLFAVVFHRLVRIRKSVANAYDSNSAVQAGGNVTNDKCDKLQ